MSSLRQTALRWMAAAALTGFALVAAALWWGPSAALRYGAGYAAELAGLQLIAVERATVSLRDGVLTLGAVEIAGPQASTHDVPHLRVASLDLRFDWRSLLAGRIEMPSVRVQGLTLDVVRADDGSFSVSGLALGAAQDAPTNPDVSALLWPVGIGRAEIVDAVLVYREGAQRLGVQVKRLTLDRFAFDDPQRKLRFDLAAVVAGANFDLRGIAAFDGSAFDGQVETTNLALAPFAKFVGTDIAGTLDAKFDIAVSQIDNAPAVALVGTAAFRALALPDAKAAHATWVGNLRWQAVQGLSLDGTTTAGTFAADAGNYKLGGDTVQHRGAVAVGADGRLDLRGTLAIEGPSLRGADLTFGAHTLRAAQLQLTRARDGKLDLRGDLAAERLALRSADLAFEAQSFGLAQTHLTRAADGALALGGSADATTVAIAAAASKLRLAKFDAARLAVSLSPDGRLTAAGNPSANEIAFERQPVLLAVRSFSADGTLASDANQLQFDGALEAGQIKFADEDIDASLAQLRYRGVLAQTVETIVGTGLLGLERGTAKSKRAALAVAFAALRHEGRATLLPQPTLAGQIAASEVSLDAADGRTLAAAARLSASDLVADATGSQAPRIDVENLRLLRRTAAGAGQPAFPWRLEAPRAALRDLRLEGTRSVAVNTIQIERPTLRATRTKDGWLSLEAAANKAPEIAPPTPIQAPAALRFAVGRLALAGARATFEDRTPETPVRLALDRIDASISDLDNARPERPTAFSLSARVGGFGQATVQGTAFAFAPLLSFDLELAAKAIDLPPLSPYVDQALGIDLRTGLGDVTASLTARDERLSGATKWRFANLQLDTRARDADADEPKIPVATILGLLADGDGTIELDIPVAGALRDPQFDTADAVRQAVGGALQGALSATFSVLFPFGTLVSNAIDSERRGTSIAIPALAFARGKSDIDSSAAAQLAALEALLEKRPAARLEVCGHAQPGEIDKADEADLLALADARAAGVKARLVASGKVAPDRVFECRPVIDEAANAAARVDLRFL